jgi:hypothetical protein
MDKDNLSGGQIQVILDHLLLEALRPIVTHGSSTIDRHIASILSAVTRNKKRRMSSIDRSTFVDILSSYLISTNSEVKVSLLAEARIERGLMYNFVHKTLKQLDGYDALYIKYMLANDKVDKMRYHARLQVLATSVSMSVDGAYIVYSQSTAYLNLLFRFRNSIVQKYSKLAYKMAKHFLTTKRNSAFELEEVVHNYLAAVAKAIDKYDSSKGALTSYIKWWILNVSLAASDQGHEYGTAFTIPQALRKTYATTSIVPISNFSLSLETLASSCDLDDLVGASPSILDEVQEEQDNQLLLKLIKLADPSGLARLYLDLPEFFFPEELELMFKTVNDIS